MKVGHKFGHAERIWLLLIALTLGSAFLAETGERSWPLTLIVAAMIAFKGRLIIDHYMEMRSANPRIRRILHAFVTVIPLLVLVSHAMSPWIARLTAL
jgi:hypothetical protein